MGITSNIVQFKGLNSLNDEEKEFLDKIAPEYYEKLKRSVHNLAQLQIHFKTYDTTGKRKRYSIHMNFSAPERNIFVSTKPAPMVKDKDWKFSKSLHEAFKNLEAQVKKAMKKDQSHPRPRD